jgi:DNA adenine methylase
MKVYAPPLKCQGIKTKLVPWIAEFAPSEFERWIEPFMGSGVVGFNMRPSKAIFADSNPHIINFYQAIQSNQLTAQQIGEYLYLEGQYLKNAEEAGYVHYRLVRQRFNDLASPLDFLFLSRAGFNGMMRFSKSGKWNIPFCKKPDRFAQAYITKIMNQTSYCAQVIRDDWQFLHQDFLRTIEMADANDLIYCDPPYLGRYTDYYNNWTEESEQRLAKALRKTKAKFMLSSWHHNDYRVNVNIQKYWADFIVHTKEHHYHAGAKVENRNPIVEALVCNFEPNPPMPLVAPPIGAVAQNFLFESAN